MSAQASNPTVASWQDALLNTAAEFGKVASDNLKRQAGSDAAKNRIEPPGQPDFKKWGIILAVAVVVLVVLKKTKVL